MQNLRTSKQHRLETMGESDVRIFFTLSDDSLIDSCIMSGCDYLPSISGIGIKKAVNLLHQQGSLYFAVNKLKQDQAMRDRIPNQYEYIVSTIRLIFKFQTVYDPFEKKQIQLHEEEYQQFITSLKNEVEGVKPDNLMSAMKPSHIQQIVGLKLEESLQSSFAEGLIDFKSLQPRSRVNVNFQRLFAKFKYEKQPSVPYTKTPQKKQIEPTQSISFDYQELPEYQPLSEHKKPKFDDFSQTTQKKTQDRENDLDDLRNICDALLQDFEEEESLKDQKETIESHQLLKQEPQVRKSHNPFTQQIEQVEKFHSLSNIKQEDMITRQQEMRDVKETKKVNIFALRQEFSLEAKEIQTSIKEAQISIKEAQTSIKQGKLQQYFVMK